MRHRDFEALEGLTGTCIGAAMDVHRVLGPGLLESAYASCLTHELRRRGLGVERERPVPLVYGEVTLECAYRLDIIVEETVIIEVKALEQVLPLHKAQLLSYLRLSGCPVGLLLNFNVTSLSRGIHRVVSSHCLPGLTPRPPLSSAHSAFKEPSR